MHFDFFKFSSKIRDHETFTTESKEKEKENHPGNCKFRFKNNNKIMQK